MENTTQQQIMKYILPKEMAEYFELTGVKENGENLILFLEEKNNIPKEYEGRRTLSKGFHPSSTIEDFPIREYKVYLEIKRRKWKDLDTGETISRSWELTARGTSYTKEFGAFLKEMARYIPG